MTERYAYSINDFPNDAVASRELTQEIDESSITEVLEGITVLDPNCYIDFAQVLSAPDKTTLDGLVAAHDGTTYVVIALRPDVKYVFGKSGAVYDGYLWTVGDISSSDQGYLIQRDITIVGLTVKATEGDYTTKEVYIQNSGVDISPMFKLGSNLQYTSDQLSIDVSVGGLLQIHVTGSGSLTNAMAQIDIVWR